MSMSIDSCSVGFPFKVFCSESNIRPLTSGLCTGLFNVILLECKAASFLLASGLLARQWSFPDSRGVYLPLSIIDWRLPFVSIPSFMQRFLNVSLDNPFSRSINRRLFPCPQ